MLEKQKSNLEFCIRYYLHIIVRLLKIYPFVVMISILYKIL